MCKQTPKLPGHKPTRTPETRSIRAKRLRRVGTVSHLLVPRVNCVLRHAALPKDRQGTRIAECEEQRLGPLSHRRAWEYNRRNLVAEEGSSLVHAS